MLKLSQGTRRDGSDGWGQAYIPALGISREKQFWRGVKGLCNNVAALGDDGPVRRGRTRYEGWVVRRGRHRGLVTGRLQIVERD